MISLFLQMNFQLIRSENKNLTKKKRNRLKLNVSLEEFRELIERIKSSLQRQFNAPGSTIFRFIVLDTFAEEILVRRWTNCEFIFANVWAVNNRIVSFSLSTDRSIDRRS